MRSFALCFVVASLVAVTGCGTSGTKSTGGTSTITGSGSNVLSIAVNGGLAGNYPDAAFASATVCVPGSTSSCVTIPDLLVDTGSTGVRIFQSELSSLNLPAVDASNGSAAYDCESFIDGAYMWGQVMQADVSLGGETAAKLPIQVISGSSAGVPSSCSNGGVAESSAAQMGANGILGVGLEPTDCYYEGVSPCSPTFGLASPVEPIYYSCSGDTCNMAFVAVSGQVANPVALFSTDNNGVIVELPSVSGSEPSVTGSLVFGIGTESNNQLPSSDTVFTTVCFDFTTKYGGQTYGITDTNNCTGPGSFIDSGSNGLYFPNANDITECSTTIANGDLAGLYCPSSTESQSATNEGENGASLSTNFTVANAETLLLGSTSSDAAMSGLSGEEPSGAGFDWGLPFFFGTNVFVSIDGQKVPSGAPAAPWWAY